MKPLPTVTELNELLHRFTIIYAIKPYRGMMCPKSMTIYINPMFDEIETLAHEVAHYFYGAEVFEDEIIELSREWIIYNDLRVVLRRHMKRAQILLPTGAIC